MIKKKRTLKQGSRYGILSVIAVIFVVMIMNVPVYAAEPTPTSRQLVEKSEDEPGSDSSTQLGMKSDQTVTANDTLPDIEIYIDVPKGFFNESATVAFSLKTKDGSMPSIKSVRARAGKKDNYTDVTESMSLVITEDCTVNVIATDSNGRTYERSRKITCFDKTAPTLNASVSEGILEVNAKDNLSGIKSIIISGYEYTDIEDGKLTIRLSQFDAGYEKFNIQAVDNAGNKSDTYKVKNPYYKSKDSDSDYNPAVELPKDTQPTETGDTTADVIEHVKTDKDGNVVVGLDLENLIKEAAGEDGDSDGESEGIKISAIGDLLEYIYPKEDDALVGREFYTITTKSGKAFYLIIDKNGDKETVRFLTDITENDLLHVVKSDSQSLPRNSAAKDSSIKDSALPNNNGNTGTETDTADGYSETRQMADEEVQQAEKEQQSDKNTEKPEEPGFIEKNMSYIIMTVAGLIAIILGYYFKVVKVRRNRNSEEGPVGDERDTGDSDEDYLGITQDDASNNKTQK